MSGYGNFDSPGGGYGGGGYGTGAGGYGGGGGGYGGFVDGPGLESPASGSPSKTTSTSQQNLVPVTARQVLSAQNTVPDQFRIDNQEIAQLKLVGQIASAKQFNTNLTWVIDDGTGLVEVKKWAEAESAGFAQAMESLKPGVYVQVVGSLRSFNDKPHILAFSIRPIEDYNQITYHFLENSPLQLERAASAGAVPTLPASSAYTAPAYQPQSSGYHSTFTPVQQAILDAVRNCGDAKGLTAQGVCGRIQMAGITEQQIRKDMDFLAAEAHLYTTVDDDHFLCSDG